MEICEATVSQLVDMGFPTDACRRAVFHTKNTGVEAAMNWVMEHIDDPGLYSPCCNGDIVQRLVNLDYTMQCSFSALAFFICLSYDHGCGTI